MARLNQAEESVFGRFMLIKGNRWARTGHGNVHQVLTILLHPTLTTQSHPQW